MKEFFAVSLPGLEDIVEQEIREWFPAFELTKVHGGVTVMAPLGEGLSLNLALKTPTRILLRLDSFRCKDFPKLYQTINEYPWKEVLDPNCEIDVHVSTRLSRLKIKARIKDTCEDGFRDYQIKHKYRAVRGKKAGLYVRFVEDQCTLSIDTSGERLHKRGVRQHIGEAPLRETIAASLLRLISQDYQGPAVELVDPMMGSGTFLLEAATRDELVNAREFGFDIFADKPAAVTKPESKRVELKKLTGFEKDKKALAAAQANLSAAGVKAQVIQQDFFTAEPLPGGDLPRWVVSNPPYGERLKVKEPLLDYYVKLFAAAEKVAKPERACFLLPSKAVKGRFALPAGWKVLSKRPFLNGGIPVVAFVFGRSRG